MDTNRFSQTGVSGGTQIQKCLFDLFGSKLQNELNRTNKKYTEFWFITDAEDSINDVNGVIKAKQGCQAKYVQQGKKLYCKEFIVGGGGSCADALKKIFVDGHFQGKAEDLGRLLKEAAASTEAANKGRKECDQIEVILNGLSYSSQASVQNALQKIEEINKKIATIQSDVTSVENTITSTKSEYQTLTREHQELRDLAQCAQTQQQIDNAEEKAMDLSQKYSNMRSKLSEAQIKASKAMKDLREAQTKAADTEKQTENLGNELSQKLQSLKSKISQLMNRLNQIKQSEEANDIKTDIKTHLRSIRTLFEDHGKATNGLFILQRDIMRSFSKLRNGKIEIDQLKRDVSAEMSKIDGIMDSLDE